MNSLHRYRRSLASLIAGLALSLTAADASALDFRMMGGMGLAIWPMELKLEQSSTSGVGLGISGRVMLQLGDFVRFQTGLLQGEFEEDDLSAVKRSFIFGSVEAVAPLPVNFYLTLGSRAGGAHLVVVETLTQSEEDLRTVRDHDTWTPLIQPIAALGYRALDKYHIELEAGLPLDLRKGGLDVSYTILIGVYFRMGGSRSR